ncbi:hypothetical protein LPJ64_003115 [Coemansia asiatica]|uniref:Uncharacterized protein n=1 Tax=Coemansia asiatica TaxID=1052880 RepID=A0A9W8CJV6_9FUNG|nr:hypothetical protein LPJ64_003115 [Coemansia asiatica]KAJ2887090.1 hypothetical protein FB639_001435 [Coemansia asiatica]
MEIVGIDDVIGTTEALLDNKGEAAMASEYPQPLQEHDDVPPPPAYQENEANSHDQYQVRLISICPFPFVYDFEFSGSSQDGRLRWIRNHEEKSSAQQQEGPWSAFLCIERTSGRVLAEVVLKSKRDSGLGTLVIHGDLDPDMHEFLVVSAIAVVEEYPVRQASFLSQT